MRRCAHFSHLPLLAAIRSCPPSIPLVSTLRSFRPTSKLLSQEKNLAEYLEQVSYDDAGANGQMFELQVLNGNSKFNQWYTRISSRELVKDLQRGPSDEILPGKPIVTGKQLAALQGLASVLTKMDDGCKKLKKYCQTNGISAVDLEIDGMFCRSPNKSDEEALAALHEFFALTATRYCSLASDSGQPLADLTSDTALCVSAPSHVIVEVCVTGAKAAQKLVQLAKDWTVCTNSRFPHSAPLLILYLNGDINVANAAVAAAKEALRVEQDNVEVSNLMEVLRHTVVLYTPFRNVYRALQDMHDSMKDMRKDQDVRDARLREDIAKDQDVRDARLQSSMEEMRKDIVEDMRKMMRPLMEGKGAA
jgi:uncharacterized protein (UPF0147 family)